MKIKVVTLAASVAALAVVSSANAATIYNPLKKPSSGNNFVQKCSFSHYNNDDSIVAPGQVGAAHNHTYMGNRSSNAFSTTQSLFDNRAYNTCREELNGSSYWFPTVYYKGVVQKPILSRIYYRAVTEPTKVKAFPQGLKIIAGNGHATGPQSQYVTDWGCSFAPSETGLRNDYTGRTMPVDCYPYGGDSAETFFHVYFPDCWDGKNLDSPDHKSHMAYSNPVAGRYWWACPTSHPVPVPMIEYKIAYRNIPYAAQHLTLSSGAPYTLHADISSAWDPARLQQLVAGCINTRTLGSTVCNR